MSRRFLIGDISVYDELPISDEERMKRFISVSQVFTPSAPIDKQSLFSGRVSQLHTVINAVTQKGQHVILFGERGVGKTSLANVISEMMKSYGIQASNSGVINCDGTDTFSSLWHKVFQELTISMNKSTIGFAPIQSWESFSLSSFAPETIAPDTVRLLLQNYFQNSIIIIDEVDRIQNQEVTALLADTVKTLSDHAVNTTIILVGVADSVDNLIAEHASVERSLVQVQMPRMSTEELKEILNKGLNFLHMNIDEKVANQIALLSQGLPHYAHLLALHAAQSSAIDNRNDIEHRDLSNAISMAVKKAQRSIITSYHKAVVSHRDTLYTEVLLACALAKIDDLGFFSASDVRKPMSIIMNKNYDISAFSRHLNDFCEEKRGPIFQRTGSPRSYRFRFINPLMQPYVIIDGLAKNLIDQNTLQRLTNQ